MKIGYIPYLNMAPFHRGFGPSPVDAGGVRFEFQTMTPHALGREASVGHVQAGALSLVDFFQLADRFEPVGTFGIGTHGPAQSVLLFSDRPMADFTGVCAVTDETSTSARLLQVLFEKKYQRSGITYGRIASSLLYDGSANGVLLIGDDALRTRKTGLKGLSFVTDLGEEWMAWIHLPFVFARWGVRKDVAIDEKEKLHAALARSLRSSVATEVVSAVASERAMTPTEVERYWDGFAYRLSADHGHSIRTFYELLGEVCLTA